MPKTKKKNGASGNTVEGRTRKKTSAVRRKNNSEELTVTVSNPSITATSDNELVQNSGGTSNVQGEQYDTTQHSITNVHENGRFVSLPYGSALGGNSTANVQEDGRFVSPVWQCFGWK